MPWETHGAGSSPVWVEGHQRWVIRCKGGRGYVRHRYNGADKCWRCDEPKERPRNIKGCAECGAKLGHLGGCSEAPDV